MGYMLLMGFDFVSLVLGGLMTLIATPAPPAAGAPPSGLLTRRVTVGTTSYSYQVYVPEGAPRGKKLPVVLFLHGIGQRGEGGFVPTDGGASVLIKGYMEKVPAIVVLPQCQRNRYWSDPEMERMALLAADAAAVEFGGDTERTSVVGVSMGGYGAWHLAAAAPGKFAAIVPICGGSPRRDGDRFAPIARAVGQTPAWVFHGADDPVVPVSESRQMVAAMKALNGNVRYSEYAGVGHNVWFKALAEPELLPWLLAQRRAAAPAART